MQVAIPWKANLEDRYGNEYNISFDQSVNNFDTLFDFILNHKDIRFNMTIENMTYQEMEVIDNINPFIFFKIPFIGEVVTEMKRRNLKFFFEYDYAPSSITLLEEQIFLGATDVYIKDDLCYNLEKVKKMCDQNGVRTRLILNKIPSTRFDKGRNPKAPIFIPECAEELSKYVDVGEIDINSWTKIDILYKIWFQRKEWSEDLRYLYQDLDIYIPNESLIPNFIDSKMNCGYKCGYGSPCRKCEQFVEIARELKSKNIEYQKEK